MKSNEIRKKFIRVKNRRDSCGNMLYIKARGKEEFKTIFLSMEREWYVLGPLLIKCMDSFEKEGF